MKKLFTLLFTSILVFSMAMPVFAQEPAPAAGQEAAKPAKKEKKMKKAKKEKKPKKEKKAATTEEAPK